MRWSAKQVNALDRDEQILVLNYAQNCIARLEQQQQILTNVNQNINHLHKETAKMRTGLLVKFLPLFLVIFLFGGWIIIGSKITCILLFFIIAGYGLIDSLLLLPARNQKAEQFFKANYPFLAMAKTSAETPQGKFEKWLKSKRDKPGKWWKPSKNLNDSKPQCNRPPASVPEIPVINAKWKFPPKPESVPIVTQVWRELLWKLFWARMRVLPPSFN